MTARSKCEAWLDGAIGFERWPDAGWVKPVQTGLADGLLGFDKNGNPAFLTTTPGSDPPLGPLMTNAVITPSGQAHILGHKDYTNYLSKGAMDFFAWSQFTVYDPKTNITWTAT